MKTVLELMEYMKLPKDMIDTAEIRPNLYFVLKAIRNGDTEKAEKLYELYQDKKVLFLTGPEIKKRRNRIVNRKVKMKYGSNWVKKRDRYVAAITRRDGHKCNHCGGPLIIGEFEIDHVIRFHDGGKHVLENMQILCRVCHDKKDNYPKGVIADGIHDRKITI